MTEASSQGSLEFEAIVKAAQERAVADMTGAVPSDVLPSDEARSLYPNSRRPETAVTQDAVSAKDMAMAAAHRLGKKPKFTAGDDKVGEENSESNSWGKVASSVRLKGVI